MSKKVGYYGADISFVDTYKFYDKNIVLYSDKVGAREFIKDNYAPIADGGFHGYVVEVQINTEVFNIHNPKHRGELYSTIPHYFEHDWLEETNRDLLFCFMCGKWQNDDEFKNASIENSDTEIYFDDPTVRNAIKSLGFGGYMALEENLPVFVIFNPNNCLEVLNVSL